MIFFTVFLLVSADIADDIRRVNGISAVMDSVLMLTEDNYIEKIRASLVLFDSELGKIELAVESLEKVVESLTEHHNKFNTTHATFIRNIIWDIQTQITDINDAVHNYESKTVLQKIPDAITGLATADTQAKNSITKIKQESAKLDSTIANNSKFFWVWGIILVISAVSVGVLLTIVKAANAAI